MTPPRRIPAADRRFLCALWEAARSKIGEDPVLLDLRPLSPWMDYFLVVTGNSPPHRSALVSALRAVAPEKGAVLARQEGKPDDGWIVLNLGTVVAHIQSPEAREFYNIEGLWGDAVRIQV